MNEINTLAYVIPKVENKSTVHIVKKIRFPYVTTP